MRTLFLLTPAVLLAAGLESGKPIRLGTKDGRGILAVGLTSYPVGAARVHGSRQPDLFAVAGAFSFPPGLFLYRWRATAPSGAPVFGERAPVKYPGAAAFPQCAIFEADGAVRGLFLEKGQLIQAVFDKASMEFKETARIALQELPRSPSAFTVLPNPGGGVELLFHIPDGVAYQPTDFNWRDARYVPFDGAGIWRGGLPYLSLYAVSMPDFSAGAAGKPRRISKSGRDVLLANHALTVVNLGKGRERDVVSGSRFGDLYYYRNNAGSGIEERRHVVGEDANAIRHSTISPTPAAYPNPATGLSDLIVGGEGALYHYRFTGRFTSEGKPVYAAQSPVLEENAELYSGSLGVPSQVDWDGDGVTDLVAGNSEGFVLFFRNAGTNGQPAFQEGVKIEAGGEPIHVQPGYKGDIQGPGEARWGYVSPNAADWNGDGLPDIVMGDSLARHMVYLNRGTRRAPRLASARPLYLDGLDLHGTWRVRPGVAKMGSRMAVVANDDRDEFHLYWRLDDYNVSDGGKLLLDTGGAIRANFTFFGGTGRSKLELTDWDRDGVVDLLVGTPRHHSVPEPEKGLPKALGLPGATVLFLKNVGTNEQPRFQFPVVLKHAGEPIYLGQHEIGATAGPLGGGPGPSLVVSREDGRLLFYRRELLY